MSLLKSPPDVAKARIMGIAERQLAATGDVELRMILFVFRLGLLDEAFDLVARSAFHAINRSDGHSPDSEFLPSVIFGATNAAMRRDVRFLDLCAKLGLCSYWVETGRWPDCAQDITTYNFEDGARRRAARRENVGVES